MAESEVFQMKSPKGTPIVGTVEQIPGRAEISGFVRDEKGEIHAEHAGGTEVFWDGQETETFEDTIVVEDNNGDRWLLRECVPASEEDELRWQQPDPERARQYAVIARATVVETGILDLLRYDSATVHEIAADHVVLRRDDGRPFTAARWQSQGVRILGESCDLLRALATARPKVERVARAEHS